MRGRFNFNGLLHFAVLLLLGFSTPVQAQIQPKDVGPLDERLTMPRNPVARNAGVWNGGSEDGGDMTFSMMQFRKNGFLGNEYTSCFGFAFFHQQHIVRLPDKNGHAYFMVTASKAYVPDDPFAARIADGRLVVYRTDRVDPATGLIPPSNRPDGTDGQIVWEYRFASTLPVGWWNHPCKMEAIGGLLMISMQMWDGEGGICSHDSGQIYGEDEALVFYDVRDPENPKYWGKMTKTELSGDGLNYGTPGYISHLNNASLVQAGDEWILTVGLDSSHVTDMKWWHTKNITPRLIDWTYGGTGTFSGAQQGSFFNSYESYNPPASAPAGTTLPGTERVMWGNADGDEGGGDAGEVSGDEAVYFGQLNFAPVGDPTSVNFAPTPTANTM